MRTHYGPWQPCWISNQHQKHKSGRGPSSEHFWQVWLISVQRFQRRRFKCEKLTDGRTTDAYPWQKLTWPMARWAKNYAQQDARFPPKIWANDDLNLKRANNGCEAFHRQFSDMFYHQPPNIFYFMDKLKHIQTYNYLKIRASGSPQIAQSIEMENLSRMKKTQENYKNGLIARAEYLKSMAYRAQPVLNL